MTPTVIVWFMNRKTGAVHSLDFSGLPGYTLTYLPTSCKLTDPVSSSDAYSRITVLGTGSHGILTGSRTVDTSGSTMAAAFLGGLALGVIVTSILVFLIMRRKKRAQLAQQPFTRNGECHLQTSNLR
ncbi:hypothetical protein BJ165DRAFT_1400869 [Panaeolus papilionaceus]|nr:hypothetical protein BJ165DRAFT_1400869 [Panaeolus papilionaceus]